MDDLLGKKVIDKITGFTGIVTGCVVYITDCNQFLVAPPVGDDGCFRDSKWIDAQRLEVTGDGPVILDNTETPGFDKAPPVR